MSHSNDLSQQLFDAGIMTNGEFLFASGQRATQKLDWDNVDQSSVAYLDTVESMAKLPEHLYVECIVPVPSGADDFSGTVGELLDVPVLYLEKDEETRAIKVPDYVNEEIWYHKNIYVVDDIFTTGSSIHRTHVALGRGTVAGAAVIWDRSPVDESKRTEFWNKKGLQVHALIHDYVSLDGS